MYIDRYILLYIDWLIDFIIRYLLLWLFVMVAHIWQMEDISIIVIEKYRASNNKNRKEYVAPFFAHMHTLYRISTHCQVLWPLMSSSMSYCIAIRSSYWIMYFIIMNKYIRWRRDGNNIENVFYLMEFCSFRICWEQKIIITTNNSEYT